MIRNSANATLGAIAKALAQLEKAHYETLVGDDGTGNDYATQVEIDHIRKRLQDVQLKIIQDCQAFEP